MLMAGLTLAVAAMVVAQTTYEGKWQGTTNTGAEVVLDLAVKDAALTGTLTRNGQATPLTEGKVSKDTITFKAKLNEQVEGLSGVRSGEQLKVWLDRQGPETAVIFTRVKSDK
jgi:hypothetical protein